MFLQKLHLENFRNLEDVKFDFRNPDGTMRAWTILLGENGCGKSSVLRAVALLLAGQDALPELLGSIDPWIRNGAEECRMSAQFRTGENEDREATLVLRRGQGISQVLVGNAEGLGGLSSALSRSATNCPLAGYGVYRRLGSSGRGRGGGQYFNAPRANAVATLFSPDASLNALDAWAMDLHYRQKEAGLAIVRDTLADLLPNVRFKEIDREAGTLIFETPDGLVPLRQLGGGYQNIAGWCGDLLFRLTGTFGYSKNPLQATGLLLLDEIDLHLHPVWQRQLRSFLASKLPNFQVLASTHSPLTAQQSGEGEIHTLQRDEDGSVTVNHFAGSATLLTVQQLVASDVFGLSTTLSTEMESARTQWKAGKSAAARSMLAGLSRPTLVPPDDQTRALLDRIESQLGKDKPKTASRKAARKTGK
jgi:predicted ATPase